MIARTADGGEKEYSVHERVHMGEITCAAVSTDGSLLLTGSVDCSLRVWSLRALHGENKRIENLYTLAGHLGRVVCVVYSDEFSMAATGSADETVMLWDIRQGKLIRVLGNLHSPVLSVSINTVSGDTAALSRNALHIFSMNGLLISKIQFSHVDTGAFGVSAGTVVLALPCAAWQESVVAVTGHEDGHVHLWKLRSFDNQSAYDSAQATPHRRNQDKLKEIYICHTLETCHKAEISMLKLVAATAKTRSLMHICFEGSMGKDLFVGDAEGYVSKWSAYRLDQLSQADAQQLVTVYGGAAN